MGVWLASKVSLGCLVVAPSAIAFGETYPQPREVSLEDIDALEKAYVDAVERCKLIGCEYSTVFPLNNSLILCKRSRLYRDSRSTWIPPPLLLFASL